MESESGERSTSQRENQGASYLGVFFQSGLAQNESPLAHPKRSIAGRGRE